MDIIELIKQVYGDSCQLRSPLTKSQYDGARKTIPGELLEILKVSNGINEVMTNPDTGKLMVIERVIYTLAEIRSQTACYADECGGAGVVFAGNGAGGFFILKPDGKIYLYEYCDLSEEYYAESLADYFNKLISK